MLIRPDVDDLRVIANALGRIFSVVAVASVLPFTWALLGREWHPIGSFVLMIGVFTLLGTLGSRVKPHSERLDWSHGMVVVALVWLAVPLIGAIPFYLSGHFGGFIDAWFDAMSGLTTTGLSLAQDLDHLAPSLNFWRHFLHFLGGQGIVIAALVLFAGGGGITLYYGEARDERIMPSVQSTAKFIWALAFAHLVAGMLVLGVIAHQVLGFPWSRAFFHALMVFFAAFDTGGFAPQSTSLGYYHSAAFELAAATMMVAGAISFGAHFALWRGDRKGVLRNLETRTILSTFGLTLTLAIIGLAATGVYASVAGLTRQGLFHVLSAHSGTGFSTIPAEEMAQWEGWAFGAIVVAMALGGMGSSTAGGVKALRVGLTIKAIATQVRHVLLPDRGTVSLRYYQGGERRLTAELGQSVMAVSLLYVGLFVLGAGAAMGYGHSLDAALFESVSAAASVGLSVGITDPSMPTLLKLVYTLQMWAGRLEFAAVFALLGFLVAWVKGR